MSKILHIDASGRKNGSISRELSRELVDKLATNESAITYRDVSQGLPFVSETMIEAYFTDKSERTEAQLKAIALSDTVVSELVNNDVLVIGVPIYNFSMPAGMKAWCDLAARVGETFRYTEKGPIGLLEGKKAYVIVASGGVKVDSEFDFLTPWLRQYLGFIGIKDVTVISADGQNKSTDEALSSARSDIEKATSI